MKLKTLAPFAACMMTLALAGCSTSGVSTHANAIDHTQTNGIESGRLGSSRISSKPKSDFASLKGDKSNAFLVAGQEHFQDQNFGLAEQNFRKAVEVRSDNAGAWLGLAASLDHLGRFKYSDRAYKQLVQLKRGNARVLNNMGYSYLLRGDYSKARKTLNRAQQIDPTLEEIQGNIHLLEKTIQG